jgi:hypothetical protein
MNQGIAFARTLRALDADDFRSSKWGLLVAVILLGAWSWWMLAARVPQYETLTNVHIESGRAIAYFPPDRLLPGQPALVHFDGRAFPSRVQIVASDHAELVFANPPPPTPASTLATAEVEVSRLSPAAIALRTLTRGRR